MKGIPPFSLVILQANGISPFYSSYYAQAEYPVRDGAFEAELISKQEGATAPLGSRLRGRDENLECGLDYLATKTVMVLRK